MGHRAWLTRIEPEHLDEFKDFIRDNPNAYGIYYTIGLAADMELFRKGLWVAWAGDGDGYLTRGMPKEYHQETLCLDDVLRVYPDWRVDPGKYGRVEHHVTAGGASLALGKKGGIFGEDWFISAEDQGGSQKTEDTGTPISASSEEGILAEAKRLLEIVHEYELLCMHGSSRWERAYGRAAKDKLIQVCYEIGVRQLLERFRDMIAEYKTDYEENLREVAGGHEIEENEKECGRLSWWNL